jgi:hypothetical protein
MNGNTVNGIIFAVIVGGVFGFLGWYFIRYVAGRRRISSGLRALGMVNFEYMQKPDSKQAVQESMSAQEARQEEDGEGDPPEK